MSAFFVGQIMLTGFPFAQKYFAQCNGQLLGISQNQALFSLLGTQYGGDGNTTFALPDLRGRAPVGAGQSLDGGWNPAPYPMGTVAGSESVTIDASAMPLHTHGVNATSAAGTANLPTTPSLYATSNPSGGGSEAIYAPLTSGTQVPLLPATVTSVGGNQPHSNMQPFRVINYNIAMSGIFPSRN